jgi:serine protease inhibitor
MHKVESYPYYEDGEHHYLKLGYKGIKAGLVIELPKDETKLKDINSDFVKSLSQNFR